MTPPLLSSPLPEGHVATARVAVNRWTDNVWALKSHLMRKFGRSSKEVDRMMELGDDFDYVD